MNMWIKDKKKSKTMIMKMKKEKKKRKTMIMKMKKEKKKKKGKKNGRLPDPSEEVWKTAQTSEGNVSASERKSK